MIKWYKYNIIHKEIVNFGGHSLLWNKIKGYAFTSNQELTTLLLYQTAIPYFKAIFQTKPLWEGKAPYYRQKMKHVITGDCAKRNFFECLVFL